MTEEEWLACDSWPALLGCFPPTTRDRKIRLFACACCREAWEFLADGSRKAVEMAERYADGDNGTVERIEAESVARQVYRSTVGQSRVNSAHAALLSVRKRFEDFKPCYYVRRAFEDGFNDTPRSLEVSKRLTALYHDLIGNPFRPITLDPSWLTSTVHSLAQQMYDSRDFSAMPILADALMDAGCSNEAILTHCRGSGPHCRGRFVVDACLGKA